MSERYEREQGIWMGGRPAGVRLVSVLIWLLFILFPLADALGSHQTLGRHLLAIGGAAAFVAAYVALVILWGRNGPGPFTMPLLAIQLALATVLTLVVAPGWGFLFTYCAACAGLARRQSLGFLVVIVSAGLSGATTSIAGGNGGTAIGFAASSLGIGLLLLLMADLRTRNRELAEARSELARLAVAEERERFARDLHDLLGHSLSVITLKAELAGRLLHPHPADAARELADIEQVARQALGEVRDAVSGYSNPTLDGEIEGARMALSAAGIEAAVQRPAVALGDDTEAVLAWAVREGATNVIRHSGARCCSVTVAVGLGDASVEVIDDGGGSVANGDGGRGGSGLPGLVARAGAVHGRVEAGDRPEGGYRLLVTVPR
jgi:two-component system, NarL family, sensor histidine kinase DesK